MKSKFETFLKQVDLFKDMTRRALFLVAEALDEEEHDVEDNIIFQGDQCTLLRPEVKVRVDLSLFWLGTSSRKCYFTSIFGIA